MHDRTWRKSYILLLYFPDAVLRNPQFSTVCVCFVFFVAFAGFHSPWQIGGDDQKISKSEMFQSDIFWLVVPLCFPSVFPSEPWPGAGRARSGDSYPTSSIIWNNSHKLRNFIFAIAASSVKEANFNHRKPSCSGAECACEYCKF